MMLRRIIFPLLAISIFTVSSLFTTAFASSDVPQVVLDLRKSVVRVVCQTSEGALYGSGFAIGENEPIQYIVTNYHVVESNLNGISILRGKNQTINAKVHIQLPYSDLCVLSLSEPLYGVPPVTLNDSKIADVGLSVYTLGFPGAADVLSDTLSGNYEDVTITDGIISSQKELTLVESASPVQLLQINAAINPGNSGGPLVDKDGVVVGVNTYTVTDSQNVNGAISIMELIDSLRSRGVKYRAAAQAAGAFPVLEVSIAAGAAIIIAAVVLIVLLSRKKKANMKQKIMPLARYMAQWGGSLPYDTAIQVLAPLLKELANIHTQGQTHSDICPETIVVSDANKAAFAPLDKASGNKVILRPGYSSPEHFRADGRIGPWSDVYSVCAVLYFMVTGKQPMGVLERNVQEGGLQFGDANIDQEHARVLQSGLALNAPDRPQNAVEFLSILGLVFNKDASAAANIPQSVKPTRKKIGKAKRVLLVTGIVLFVLCLCAGGFYLFEDYHYNQAVACIDRQEYVKGKEHLLNDIKGFRDSDTLLVYAWAGEALQSGKYDDARAWYSKLGDFKNSREMLKEVDYQQALQLLDDGDYKRSGEMFASISEYRNAKQMVLETKYQNAIFFLKNMDYSSSIKMFGELSKENYKDSEMYALESEYQQALAWFGSKDYKKAEQCFKKLTQKRYKDSELLLAESQYLRAIELFEARSYEQALVIFEDNIDYKRSIKYVGDIVNSLYNQGVEFYRQKKFIDARNTFDKVKDYKNCSNYYVLIKAHSYFDFVFFDYDTIINLNFDYNSLKTIYQKVKSLGSFEDAEDIRISDTFIEYRLEGSWKGGGYYFRMNYTKTGWYTSYNIPWISGKYYQIKNGIMLFGSDEKGYKRQYRFHFISENAMNVYCYKNGRTYYLTR